MTLAASPDGCTRSQGRLAAGVDAMMHRTGDVLAGVVEAWLQEVGDAGDSTEVEADFTSRRAAEEADEGSALSAGRSPGRTVLRLAGWLGRSGAAAY